MARCLVPIVVSDLTFSDPDRSSLGHTVFKRKIDMAIAQIEWDELQCHWRCYICESLFYRLLSRRYLYKFKVFTRKYTGEFVSSS